MKKVFFSCGDRSADIYLSELLKAIRNKNTELKCIVLGGEFSKPYSDLFFEDLVGYDAHGFFSPIILFFRFIRLLKRIKKFFLKERIDLVVLLDYYGFNIHIAKVAKKYNVPVLYYITPQIWATRKNRIKKIKRYVDEVINIYPFEVEIYNKKGIKAEYVGHPMMDIISRENTKVVRQKNIIGIFPGSRKQVIRWNLPVMLRIVRELLREKDFEKYQFVIFGFERYSSVYEKYLKKFRLKDKVLVCYDKSKREDVLFAISVSGTVVLENVLYNIPMVVIYNLPEIMYIMIKSMIKIRNIALPNIILKEEVIKEYVGTKIKISDIVGYIKQVLTDKEKMNKILTKYEMLKNILKSSSNKKVSEIVAEKINSFVKM